MRHEARLPRATEATRGGTRHELPHLSNREGRGPRAWCLVPRASCLAPRVFFALALLLAACNPGARPPVGITGGLADSAEQVAFNVRHVLTQNGVQRGELFADTMFVFDDQTRYAFQGVRATFNNERGVRDGNVRADRGSYSLRSHVLEGWGNVIITTTDGRRLEAPHLIFRRLANEVATDSAFVMTDARGMVTRGVGFRADPGLNRIQILRRAGGSAVIGTPGQ